MDISNEDLFRSALEDQAPQVEAETPEPESVEQPDERPRDEQGRFAPKSEELEAPQPEAKAEATQAKPEAKDEGQIPSWRLREIREERDQLKAELEQFRRQFQQQQPKPAEAAKPDLFEKPDEFVRANVQEVVSPIEQRLSQTIENWSRTFAIKEHGEERVSKAFSALDQAAKSGDPQAQMAVQAVKQSPDPYGELVKWYSEREAMIDPEAHFQRRLEEALKKEDFRAQLAQKLGGSPQGQPGEKPKPVFSVPPSLNRAASAAPQMDDGGDFSNESLFRSALG